MSASAKLKASSINEDGAAGAVVLSPKAAAAAAAAAGAKPQGENAALTTLSPEKDEVKPVGAEKSEGEAGMPQLEKAQPMEGAAVEPKVEPPEVKMEVQPPAEGKPPTPHVEDKAEEGGAGEKRKREVGEKEGVVEGKPA